MVRDSSSGSSNSGNSLDTHQPPHAHQTPTLTPIDDYIAATMNISAAPRHSLEEALSHGPPPSRGGGAAAFGSRSHSLQHAPGRTFHGIIYYCYSSVKGGLGGKVCKEARGDLLLEGARKGFPAKSKAQGKRAAPTEMPRRVS